MAAPRFGPPPTQQGQRNPFDQRGPPPSQNPYPRRDYDNDNDSVDHYGSTTRLTNHPDIAYNHRQYDPSGMSLQRWALLSLVFMRFVLGSSDNGHGSYAPSIQSNASGPSISPFMDPGLVNHDPYPAWSADRQIPMSTEEIEDIFLDLQQKFGFQKDNMRNTVRSYNSKQYPHI